jgi:hypothetical protein
VSSRTTSCSTYQSIAPYIEPPPEEVYFGVGILAATGSPAGDVVLPPHGVDSFAWLTADIPDDAQLPDTAGFRSLPCFEERTW